MPENLRLEDLEQEVQPKPNLNRSQKIAAASLAFFAVFVLFIWVWQFKHSLSAPFDASPELGGITADTTENDMARLQAIDTDNDGLSDWEELNNYNTSPYLDDSDSDGFSDKEEIDNDKDPNCPSGKDCSIGPVSGDSTVVNSGEVPVENDESSLNTLLQQMGYDAASNAVAVPAGAPADANGLSASENALLSGTIDAAGLRALLIERGVKPEVLEKISDAQLMESFQSVLKQ